MLKPLLFSLVLLLSACTTLPTVQRLPAQSQPLQAFKVEHNGRQSLLLIQFEPNRWRWIQTDPIGAPIARVVLTENGWQQDGFIMPNKQAQRLFTVLANALNPQQPPFRLDHTWKIEQNAERFLLTLPDHSQWRVEALP